MKLFSRIYRSVMRLYERRFEPERLRPLAEDYWRLLLSGGLVGIAGVIVFGIVQFVGTLENLSSAAAGGARPSAALERTKLQSVLSAYEQRQSDYSAAQHSVAAYPDPSD